MRLWLMVFKLKSKMSKVHFVLFFVVLQFVCLGCRDKNVANDRPTDQKTFKMYQHSEMAMLMEQMYVDNLRLKEAIENGETNFGPIPDYYQKIFVAVLTDPSDRDAFFNEKAKEYLVAQTEIYQNSTHPVETFNKMVESCIGCHKVKCGGPIARIKKLIIQ